MNWKEYWNTKGSESTSMAQVGRDVNEEDFKATLHYLESLIQPISEMRFLDICCGNGMISHYFAPKVKSLVGIDLSSVLLANAKELNVEFSNCHFIESPAERVGEAVNEKVDCALLHFSFQYFESDEQALEVLKGIKSVLKPEGKAFITDIPNHYRASELYPGIKGRLRYLKHLYFGGGEMGRFWKPEKLVSLAEIAGFKVEVLNQPNHLPYSHYRFDLSLVV